MVAAPLSQPIQILGCLAFGGDLSMGQPIDHSPRTAVLAWRLSRELGFNAEIASCAATLGLVRWAGCTANAQGFAELFGNDIACRAAFIENRSPLVSKDELASPVSVQLRPLAEAHCEATVEMSRQLGLSSHVGVAARDLFEHWNGGGVPSSKRHEEIDQLARIVAVAGDIEILSRVFGLGKALDLMERKSGAPYDPAYARVAEKHASNWLTDLSRLDAWTEAAFIVEEAFVSAENDEDSLIRLLADYADLKVPRHFQISRKTAEMATLIASTLGMSHASIVRLKRAALLHGLGRVAVPNATLERDGPPTEADNEHIRLIPYWTERILKRAPQLAAEAVLASQAYERLDGSGFPRGVRGRSVGEEARVLQSSVFVVTCWEHHKYRGANDIAEIKERITAEVTAGRLDSLCADAALAACGLKRTMEHPSKAPSLHITERERDVLVHLARGLTNKEIARVLSISPSTAGTHVENLYRKLEVSTRAAAALAALRLDLVDV